MDKKYIIIVFVLISISLGILILSARMMTEESKVNWVDNYDEGLSKARAENKIVLLYFYDDMCIWCDKLDQETYDNQSIASYLNEKLVCIKINVEKNISHFMIFMNYNVYGTPTIVFLSSNGEEVGRIGYKPPVQFLEYVSDIVKQYD